MASAQLATTPGGGVMWYRAPAAAGGCSGVAGAPGLTVLATNKLITASEHTITATLPAITGGCQPYVIVFAGQYNVTVSGVTNSAGQSGALWTNYSTGCTPVEKGGVWVFNNPPTSSQVYGAQLSGAGASQSGIIVMGFTNCSGLGNIYTNCSSSTTPDLTLTATSAANQIIVKSTLSDKTGTGAPPINGVTTGTLKAMADNATADQTMYAWTETGSASVNTRVALDSGVDWTGEIVLCLVGY